MRTHEDSGWDPRAAMAAQNEPAVRRKGAILAAAVFDFPF
jgi:hypothetical protein